MGSVKTKKNWQTPEVWVLDTNPEGGNLSHHVHEHTGHRVGHTPNIKATTPQQQIETPANAMQTRYSHAVS